MKSIQVIDTKTRVYPDVEQIVTTEEWAKGMIYRETDTFAMTENGNLILLDERGCYAVCPEDRFFVALTKDDTQCHDKNGKRIYQGDIVVFDGETYYIQYSYGSFLLCNNGYMYWHMLRDVYQFLEVVGNMKDNPELLKPIKNKYLKEK